MKRIAKLAMTIAVLPTLASAEDKWTGVYLGAHVAATDSEISPLTDPNGNTVALSDNAAAFGVQAGYNHTLSDNWVIGGEFSYSTAEYSYLGLAQDADTTRIKLKAGYGFGSALIYGTMGYANLVFVGTIESGTTYGIGANYKATDNIILGVELSRDLFDVSGVDVDLTSLGVSVAFGF